MSAIDRVFIAQDGRAFIRVSGGVRRLFCKHRSTGRRPKVISDCVWSKYCPHDEPLGRGIVQCQAWRRKERTQDSLF